MGGRGGIGHRGSQASLVMEVGLQVLRAIADSTVVVASCKLQLEEPGGTLCDLT